MPINIQGVSRKLICSDHRIVKIYCENNALYSDGNRNTVTFHVDAGLSYQEEIDEGASCLSPKTFTPSKSGWEFVGWRQDTVANESVLSSKLMGDDSIMLYAVFRQAVTVTYYNNSTTASSTSGYRYYNNGNTVNPSFVLTQASSSGWTATGWSTGTAGNSGITYNNGAAFTRDSNITLYGLYQQIITVTYYNNSTTAATTSGTRYYNSSGNVVNPSFTLTPATLSGWTFRGWTSSSAAMADIEYISISGTAFAVSATVYAAYYQTITLSTVANGTTSSTSGYRYFNTGNYQNPTFTVANPTNSDASFLGWSSSADSTTISNSTISNLALSESTTRYAVFKYADASMTTYFTDTDWVMTEGGQPRTVEVVVQGASSIDTNKYSAATIKSYNVHPEVNWRGCRTSMYYRIGRDTSECFAWYDSGWVNNPTNSNYAADVTTNMSISPDQGVVPLYLRITISVGDSNAGRGRGYMNSTGYGSISLTGRAVVG